MIPPGPSLSPWFRMKRRLRLTSHMNPPVFLGSAGVIVAFLLFGTLFSDAAEASFEAVQGFLVSAFGWFYVLTASMLLLFVLYLLGSRFGSIRLGGCRTLRPWGDHVFWP